MERQEIEEMVKAVNGRRRSRIIGKHEIDNFLELMAEHADDLTTRIRVYSRDGFVANSYKYAAPISYLEATRNEAGEWNVRADKCDAKKSWGNGSTTVVR